MELARWVLRKGEKDNSNRFVQKLKFIPYITKKSQEEFSSALDEIMSSNKSCCNFVFSPDFYLAFLPVDFHLRQASPQWWPSVTWILCSWSFATLMESVCVFKFDWLSLGHRSMSGARWWDEPHANLMQTWTKNGKVVLLQREGISSVSHVRGMLGKHQQWLLHRSFCVSDERMNFIVLENCSWALWTQYNAAYNFRNSLDSWSYISIS